MSETDFYIIVKILNYTLPNNWKIGDFRSLYSRLYNEKRKKKLKILFRSLH